MTDDPRIEGLGDNYPTGVATQMRMEAEGWVKTFDERDAAAGVVRVDTRDPATETLIRTAICDPGQFLPRGDNYTESIGAWGARAVLAALTEATP